MPGVLIVGLESRDGGLQGSNTLPLLTSKLNEMIRNINPPGLRVNPLNGSAEIDQVSVPSTLPPPPLMVFDRGPVSVAIGSFQLVSDTMPTMKDTNDLHLQAAVDAINSSINNVPIDTGAGTVWLIGAAPDFIVGSSAGMGPPPTPGGSADSHGGGSPDGPPGPANGAQWRTTRAPDQTGPRVYILDTAGAPGGTLCLDSPPNTLPTPSPTPTPTPSPTPSCSFLNLHEDAKFPSPDTLKEAAFPYTGNEFSFPQHGQFVAKIIQHQSPGADLHLIRVLNDYGAADERSLIYGLQQVFTQTMGRGASVVVNLSLTFPLPTGCLPQIWQHFTRYQTETWRLSMDGLVYPVTDMFAGCLTTTLDGFTSDRQYQRLYVPLGLAVGTMIADRYQLVAAAGNDSGGSKKFGAGMPAAFCGAIAVGASRDPQPPRRGAPPPLAPFSNNPALDNDQCIRVPLPSEFRGDTPEALSQPVQVKKGPSGSGPGTGNEPSAYATGSNVCSLDLEVDAGTRTPKYTNGMALWSGTSFATPFVSALIANGSSSTNEEQPCGKP
jgi:hypothetical protein